MFAWAFRNYKVFWAIGLCAGLLTAVSVLSLLGFLPEDKANSTNYQVRLADSDYSDRNASGADKLGQPNGSTADNLQHKKTRDGKRAIVQAYKANNLEELKAATRLFALGEFDPDAFGLMNQAEYFCAQFNNPASVEKFRNSEYFPSMMMADKSLAYLAAQARRFCGTSDSRQYFHGPNFVQWRDNVYQWSNDKTLKQFIDVKRASVADSGYPSMDDLESILYRTESPYIFQEIGAMLISHGHVTGYRDWDVGPPMRNIGPDARAGAIRIGLALANCRLSNGCGPNSLISISYCQPYYCAPGVTVETFLRAVYPPLTFQIGQSIARSILEARQRQRLLDSET